jgi:hypothetical protein
MAPLACRDDRIVQIGRGDPITPASAYVDVGLLRSGRRTKCSLAVYNHDMSWCWHCGAETGATCWNESDLELRR